MLGLIFSMLLPATLPWWAVITGTFVLIIIGKQIFGGIGASPFNPAVLAVAILGVSWKHLFNFDGALLSYDFGFVTAYPMAALKNFGPAAIGPLPHGTFSSENRSVASARPSASASSPAGLT